MGTPGGKGHMIIMDIPIVKHVNLVCSLDPEFIALLNSVILNKPNGYNWSLHDIIVEKVLDTSFSDDCDSGVDVSTYKAHSVRGASTSKAEGSKSMSCNQIIKAANWSNVSTFKRFYLRDIETVEDEVSLFTQAVLS